MSKRFMLRTNTANHGGIHVPFHLRGHCHEWKILIEDSGGTLVLQEVVLPPDLSPLMWLEKQGHTLMEDALAELACCN